MGPRSPINIKNPFGMVHPVIATHSPLCLWYTPKNGPDPTELSPDLHFLWRFAKKVLLD